MKDLIETLQKFLPWVAGLSIAPKIVISIIIVLLAILFLILIWQPSSTQVEPGEIKVSESDNLKLHQLSGQISYLVVWRFSSNHDGKITDRKFIPSLWIKNEGKEDIIIKKIRIILKKNDRLISEIYPENRIPLDAVNNPCEFHEYGRLSAGGPFSGFDLPIHKKWISQYCFNLPVSSYDELKDNIDIFVEAKIKGSEWHKVVNGKFIFGSYPFHLQPMKGGSQAIFIYNRPSNKGDTLYCIDELGDLKILLKK